jgi:hypothetical protein
MLKMRRTALAAAFSVAVAIPVAWAAGLFPNFPIVGGASYSAGSGVTVPAGPAFLTCKELIPADTQLAGGVAPQTVTIPSGLLANCSGTPRNFLDNGALNITNTNGTATVTCAVNAAIAVANMSADRWGCQANVAAGAGRTAIITASPAPPAGFTNSMKVFRTSGALTQPICVMQEVTTPQTVQLAGQTVTFSFQAAALAGLSADNGNVINAVIFTGTGTDQLLTTAPTASPAITPAWTGVATTINQAISITTSFVRYSVNATIPTTATEIGVALCFTPTATGAGATDGFAWTGAQLEIAPSPTAFEFRPKAAEILVAQQYFYKVTEGAAAGYRAICGVSTTSATNCNIPFPVTMYATPTMGYTAGFASCTTVACTAVSNCTSLATSTTVASTAATPNAVLVTCGSAAAFAAAGSAGFLYDNGGSGVITAWTGL